MNGRYLSTQPGLRRFVLAALAACALGLWFRLSTSSDRLRSWIEPALKRAPPPLHQITFERAELVLRRGLWPVFAVRLTDVQAPAPEACEPGRIAARASEIEVPLRLGALLTRAEAAAGVVAFSDLDVDLDAWRPGCGRLPAQAPPVAEADALKGASAGSLKGGLKGARTREAPAAQPWWQPGDFEAARRIAIGVRAVRAKLRFEGGAKVIAFDSIEARVEKQILFVRLRARVPAELTYGEALPPIGLEGEATAEGARLVGDVGIDEGRLRVLAALKPMSDGGVWIEASASAKGVPASALAPLARRLAGRSEFQPRFMWLECAASIRGKVQGLFESAPLAFERCVLEGESGRASIEAFSRQPDGSFSPFAAKIERLDARAWTRAFGFEGPSGVLSDFGKIDGEVRHLGRQEWTARAKLSGARAVFVSREARAHQGFTLEASMERRGSTARGRIESASFDGGAFDGDAKWEFDVERGGGSAEIAVRAISFAPDVQRAMLDGSLRALSGAARLEFGSASADEEGDSLSEPGEPFALRRARFEGAFRGLESAHARAERGSIKGEYAEGVARATARIPRGELPSDGAALSAFRQLFLGHRFSEPWLDVMDASAKLAISRASFGWGEAQAKLAGGRVLITSSGNIDRAKRIVGVIEANYPKATRARFALSGPAWAPTLEPIIRAD